MKSVSYLFRRPKYTFFIIECADGTYFSQMTGNFDKAIRRINARKGYYFSTHPERFPFRVVFREDGLPFREAWAKQSYIRTMRSPYRRKIVQEQKWVIGGAWRDYIVNYLTLDEDLEREYFIRYRRNVKKYRNLKPQ